MDKTNADGLSSFRSLKTLNAIVNSLKGEIYGYYKYHAIVCKNAENFVGVTKAQLHTDDQFIFDGPTMKAIEIYNNVNSNLNTSFEPPTLGGLDDEGDVSLLDSLV